MSDQSQPSPMALLEEVLRTVQSMQESLSVIQSQLASKPKAERKPLEKPVPGTTQDAGYRLAQLMARQYVRRFPDSILGKRIARNAEHVIQKWFYDLEKLIRLDKVDPRHVATVIEWLYDPAAGADFWAGNIASGMKLRQHYDRLWQECQRNSVRPATAPQKVYQQL